MSNQRKKGTKQFTAWLTEDQRTALAAIAKIKGVSKSGVLHQVINDFIASNAA